MEQEKSIVDSGIFCEKAGIFSALLIAIVGLAVAAFCAVKDHETTASIIGGSTIVALVSAFISERKYQSTIPKDNEKKHEQQNSPKKQS